MSPRDIGGAEGVMPTGLADDVASFLDPAPRERRDHRRRRESSTDDAALRRLMFGGMSLRTLGGLLVVAGVLVVAAGVFVTNWDGPVGGYFDRSGYEHRRMTERDQDYAYAYADYMRRYDTGAAWSGGRADADADEWTIDPEALTTGGLLGLLGVGLLVVARRRPQGDHD